MKKPRKEAETTKRAWKMIFNTWYKEHCPACLYVEHSCYVNLGISL